ncbi:MAG: outer membrane protein assembly factor BamD [Gammaproteobacteria bacterium]
MHGLAQALVGTGAYRTVPRAPPIDCRLGSVGRPSPDARATVNGMNGRAGEGGCCAHRAPFRGADAPANGRCPCRTMALEWRSRCEINPMHKLYWLPLALALTACSALEGVFEDKEDETKEWSAEKLYSEAKDSLQDEYYTKAIEYNEKLLARYPFGPNSQQAQLDLAYAYFKNDEAVSAVAACDRFMKLYPDNRHVDYAYYLKGLARFQEGKGLAERFLDMDMSQRDQASALKAFQDFAELTRRFPTSRYARDAQLRMTYLRNLLAQHEINVAHYYMRRGAYVAAASRARYVVEHYQRAPAMADALILMAKAYRVLALDDLADDAIRVLEHNYPSHPGIEEVRAVRVAE